MDVQGVLWCSLPRFLPCFSFFGVSPIDARGFPPASPRAPGGAVSPGFCLLAVLPLAVCLLPSAVLPLGCFVFGCLPFAFGFFAAFAGGFFLPFFCLFLLNSFVVLLHLFFAFSLFFHCFICLFCCSSFIFFLINIGPHDCDLVSPP